MISIITTLILRIVNKTFDSQQNVKMEGKMAMLSDQRLKEMEAEMNRSVGRQGNGGGQPRMIIGANTFHQVKAKIYGEEEGDEEQDHDDQDDEEDEDFRHSSRSSSNPSMSIPLSVLQAPPPPPPSLLSSARPQRAGPPLLPPPPPPPNLRPQLSFVPPQLRQRPPPPPPHRHPGPGPGPGGPGPGGPGPRFGPGFGHGPGPGPQRPFHPGPPPPPSGLPPQMMPPGMPGPQQPYMGPGPSVAPSHAGGPYGVSTGEAHEYANKVEERKDGQAFVIEKPKVVYSGAPTTVSGKKKRKKEKPQKQEKSEDNTKEIPDMAKPAVSITEPTGVIGPVVVPQIEDISSLDQDLDGEGTGAKKSKKEKKKKFVRTAAGETWEDPSLEEWNQDDFRIFCGDLGNEVTDEVLARAFSKYGTFVKAKVIRDKRTNKTKGFGFASFKDPNDFARAMREMNGKYVGNRPIKLRKSTWKDRNIEIVRKKEKEKKRLGLR
ncbi:hypothetical protein KUTeg_006261 [Tegillarca granosa]|uniref:RNA-binding protein 42 n=1 Tax=Tegillarca granosa TaxID=220873 RepID=A0ABQ9FI81_TEGGR|nr:hypothetical protein KUTeg_006261 [Tegillarca granosa]